MRPPLPLSDSEWEALRQLAAREDRSPRDQARRMLREALLAAGALAEDTRPCVREMPIVDTGA